MIEARKKGESNGTVTMAMLVAGLGGLATALAFFVATFPYENGGHAWGQFWVALAAFAAAVVGVFRARAQAVTSARVSLIVAILLYAAWLTQL